jgi:hypothetical protein
MFDEEIPPVGSVAFRAGPVRHEQCPGSPRLRYLQDRRDGDDSAVLDSRFRVRGTKGLRVVDASVFPKIPGLFILSAVYMVAEKASDVILADAT